VGMAELLKSDTALNERFERTKEALEDTNGRDSLSMAAAKLIAKEPQIASVYRKAGITPEVAGMTMETLLGCMFGEAMMNSTGTNAKLPAGFVAENMEFYKAHRAEIMVVLESLKKFQKDEPAREEDADENEEEEKP